MRTESQIEMPATSRMDPRNLRSLIALAALDFIKMNEAENTTFGRKYSSVQIPYQAYPLKITCLGFWVAYFREETLLAWNCLKTAPFWMEQDRKFIGNVPLSEAGNVKAAILVHMKS